MTSILLAVAFIAVAVDLWFAPAPAWWARAAACLLLVSVARDLILRPPVCSRCGQPMADRGAALECDEDVHLRAHMPRMPRLPRVPMGRKP
jgi:hypothetical protein